MNQTAKHDDLLAEWARADAAARAASHALDEKMARYACGLAPAPSLDEHQVAFQLCAVASRAALALAAQSAQQRDRAYRRADSGLIEST